ncbi:MAG: hypothetical protein GF364_03985, partial [Candidatus Lokiarchaeota archaeon]|nr:hypothetical protein [Candidatus Lokiarchaeota archaeon]
FSYMKNQNINVKNTGNRALIEAIKKYRLLLYGLKSNDKEYYQNNINLSQFEKLKLLLPMIPKLIGRFTPGLIQTIMPFLLKLGTDHLDAYIAMNLNILKVQAERIQNTSVNKIHKLPNATYPKWPKKQNLELDKKEIQKKLRKIVDLERIQEYSSFERFHRPIYGKKPDRIPFAPLMDNFYARMSNLTVQEFVSQPYNTIFKIVEHTHDTFLNYFDMVHLPPGRIYSFFQPLPAAHSAYYAELHLPKDIGQVLQFIEKNYINLEDFPKIKKEGFSSVWRPRPLKVVLETMLDFITVGNFFYKWERKKQVPLYTGSAFVTPLEALSYLMGINKWSRAILRDQERTMEACDLLMEGLMANDLLLKEFSGVKRDYICLERVSPQFISPKIFEKMVWPHIKQLVDQNVKLGYINLFHMDTDWLPFLHYFAELPKRGKYIFHLENTDIVKANEIVGSMGAVFGNLDGNLLVFGTPEKVSKHVSNLITQLKDNGNFILSAGCHLPPDTPIPNIIAIIKTLEEEGYY